MKIGLLTYDMPHRKTQDVLFRLNAKGYKDITLIIQPIVKLDKVEPLYPHRPSECIDVSAKDLAKIMGVNYHYCDHNSLNRLSHDVYLIGGARIIKSLPKEPVINTHPGLLPYTRGLDSFKWAIYHSLPIGVTVHKIDEKIDSGEIIYKEELSKNPAEDFYHLAMRLYYAEIDSLVNHFNSPPLESKPLLYEEYPDRPFGRMGYRDEIYMMNKYKSL